MQVVPDPKMHKALLRGPLVSFETVVPPKPRRPMVVDEDTQDKTYNWVPFKTAATQCA